VPWTKHNLTAPISNVVFNGFDFSLSEVMPASIYADPAIITIPDLMI